MTGKTTDPSKMKETETKLNDLREKILSIGDQNLSVEILEHLDSISTQLADKTEMLASATTKQGALLAYNTKLQAQITASNALMTNPTTNPNYSEFDNNVDNLIAEL